MDGNLLYALIQRESPILDEIRFESTNVEWILFWDGRDDNTGIVGREGLIEPEEIRISSKDRKGGFHERRRSCLQCLLSDSSMTLDRGLPSCEQYTRYGL